MMAMGLCATRPLFRAWPTLPVATGRLARIPALPDRRVVAYRDVKVILPSCSVVVNSRRCEGHSGKPNGRNVAQPELELELEVEAE